MAVRSSPVRSAHSRRETPRKRLPRKSHPDARRETPFRLQAGEETTLTIPALTARLA